MLIRIIRIWILDLILVAVKCEDLIKLSFREKMSSEVVLPTNLQYYQKNSIFMESGKCLQLVYFLGY